MMHGPTNIKYPYKSRIYVNTETRLGPDNSAKG